MAVISRRRTVDTTNKADERGGCDSLMPVAPFYHYTDAASVLPIKEQGLLPTVDKVFSPDHPVVWVTTQEDVSVAPEDAIAMAKTLGFYEAPLSELARCMEGGESPHAGAIKQWWYGTKGRRLSVNIDGRECTIHFVPAEDDLVRMKVELPDNDAKLFRFVTWPNRPRTSVHRLHYRYAHIRLWHVYLGRISPDRITEITEVSDDEPQAPTRPADDARQHARWPRGA
jgi:hypothetical protein